MSKPNACPWVMTSFAVDKRMQNAKGVLQELLQGRGRPVPQYQTLSTGHPLRWLSQVTVEWEGRQITEATEGTGKKKDVEQAVAEIMLRRLQREIATPSRRTVRSPSAHTEGLSPTGRGCLARSTGSAISPRPSASPTVSPACLRTSTPFQVRTSPTRSMATGRERGSSPSLSPLSPAGASGSLARSPVSVLQERLQQLSLAPPRYEVEAAGLSLVPSFQCRCVVRNTSRQPVLEAVGEGPSKQRAKEKAAEKMLEKFSGCWMDGTFSMV